MSMFLGHLLDRSFRRQPLGRGRSRGVWGRVAPREIHNLVKTAFHVSIRTPRYSVGSTMSHPSGGSRRDTALLSGVTPTQANGTSACDARCGMRHPRPWFTVLRAGRRTGPVLLGIAQEGRDITERFVFDQQHPRILQHPSSYGDNRRLFVFLACHPIE